MLVRIVVLRIVVAPAGSNTNAPPLNSTFPVAFRFVITEAGISKRLHQIAQLHQPRRKKVSGPRRTLVGDATTIKVGSGLPFAALHSIVAMEFIARSFRRYFQSRPVGRIMVPQTMLVSRCWTGVVWLIGNSSLSRISGSMWLSD